jgi:apolipoprotein N-acyltransferase
MKKKGRLKVSKKTASLGGVAAILIVLAGGGWYLGTKDTKTPTSEEQKQQEIQQNLESKEKQLESNNTSTENTNQNTPAQQSNAPATSESSLGTLPSASITAMKDGTTIYLSVYGIAAGKYEVEKNGKVIVAATDYSGHGGLALPSFSETSATYQVFLLTNGKRSASSKAITVSNNFTGTKEFSGA